MATSLPPSPTDAVLKSVNSFIFLTMIAFWVGEHQQTQTAGQAEATSKNSFSSFGVDKQVSNVVPSITRTVFPNDPTSLLSLSWS